MNSLALINEFLGQPPNASSHGLQIDHILEFCHWFMGALFIGWSVFFIFVLIRFRRRRQPKANHLGVTSPISTHLEFSVVLIEAVLLLGFAIPLWGKRVNRVSARQRGVACPRRGAAIQLQLSFAGSRRTVWPARCRILSPIQTRSALIQMIRLARTTSLRRANFMCRSIDP